MVQTDGAAAQMIQKAARGPNNDLDAMFQAPNLAFNQLNRLSSLYRQDMDTLQPANFADFFCHLDA